MSSARFQIVEIRQPSLLHKTIHSELQREVSKKKLDSLTSVAAAHESQRPKLVDERDEVFFTCRFGGDALNRVIKLREHSLTLDGKKEEQSCPNDKRNELCVSMAIKMNDDK